MKDWRRLAEALNLGIPEPDLERIERPLDALEASFRPLLATLPLQTEPAYLLLLFREEGA
ncbi:MAG: hypothetical protein K6U88_13680 [Dehalococcoidia bacterium]|jgi:hypothetical protein|nr:hypothetical protein [Dehalococcoidia bacterium]